MADHDFVYKLNSNTKWICDISKKMSKTSKGGGSANVSKIKEDLDNLEMKADLCVSEVETIMSSITEKENELNQTMQTLMKIDNDLTMIESDLETQTSQFNACKDDFSTTATNFNDLETKCVALSMTIENDKQTVDNCAELASQEIDVAAVDARIANLDSRMKPIELIDVPITFRENVPQKMVYQPSKNTGVFEDEYHLLRRSINFRNQLQFPRDYKDAPSGQGTQISGVSESDFDNPNLGSDVITIQEYGFINYDGNADGLGKQGINLASKIDITTRDLNTTVGMNAGTGPRTDINVDAWNVVTHNRMFAGVNVIHVGDDWEIPGIQMYANYGSDGTERNPYLPGKTEQLISSIFEKNGTVGSEEAQELTVQMPRDFLNNVQTWRVYGQKRLKNAFFAAIPASADINKIAIKDDLMPTLDMSNSLPDRQTLLLQVFDQGRIGSCYANAMAFLVYLNRILSDAHTVQILQKNGKFIYGFNIPVEDNDQIYYNYDEKFDSLNDALIDVLYHINAIETLDTPSRAYIQYTSKRRRTEIDQNTESVLEQGNVLEIVTESLRVFGTINEHNYQYPAIYYGDTNEFIDDEEFLFKYSFPPDPYLMTRANIRQDMPSLQIIPVHIKDKSLFPDDYMPSPIVHEGLSTADNKSLTLIKALIANYVPLFLNWKLYTEYTQEFDRGIVFPPTADAITASETNPQFHTSVITAYYDTDDNPSGVAGVIVVHNSWGSDLDYGFQGSHYDNQNIDLAQNEEFIVDNRGDGDKRMDDGVFYIKYSDFFQYFAVSVWALSSDLWVHVDGLFENFNFTDPTIFNTEETEKARRVARRLQAVFKQRRQARTRRGKGAKRNSTRKSRRVARQRTR